jgi:hypothetical protein
MVVDGVAPLTVVNVMGLEGGPGGYKHAAFRLRKGSGLTFADICHVINCGEFESSYSVAMKFNMDGLDPTSSAIKRLVSAQGVTNGLVLADNNVKIVGSESNSQGGTYVQPFTWTRMALSVSKTSAMTVDVDGNTDISGLDGGYSSAMSLTSSPFRLFNDHNLAQCSANNDLGTALVSDLMVFNRPLSVSEAENVVESLRVKCGGTPGECSDHGYCRDGRCVCDHTEEGGWKGEFCQTKSCKGLPECNNRGVCTADGTCECFENYHGDACQLAMCPGKKPCSGHGECVTGTDESQCECHDGYWGDDCSKKYCPGDVVKDDGTVVHCSGRGTCNTARGICTCNVGVPSKVVGYTVSDACEGGSVTLSCDNGVIHVMSARWGRLSTTTCAGTDVSNGYNCHADRSVSVMEAECEGKTTCTVAANNGVFGDPCGGVHKSLVVSHSCVESLDTFGSLPADCSLSVPDSGLAMDMDVNTYTTGDITTGGYADVAWHGHDTREMDGSRCWWLNPDIDIKRNAYQFPQTYTVAYWLAWRENQGSWRTLLRGNSDHQVIVKHQGTELGMYSNRQNGFRGIGYNIQYVGSCC